MSYTALPQLYRLPGERIPEWACVCPGLKPYQKHREPWLCIPDEEVAAWRARHPEAFCSGRTARILTWLAGAFANGGGR